MFHHVKELQFDARVSRPDPRFARLLLEQFGGGNGELKAAMQYFTQAFGCRRTYPDKYDLLMDLATEEFSHLEIVGATITMLGVDRALAWRTMGDGVEVTLPALNPDNAPCRYAYVLKLPGGTVATEPR